MGSKLPLTFYAIFLFSQHISAIIYTPKMYVRMEENRKKKIPPATLKEDFEGLIGLHREDFILVTGAWNSEVVVKSRVYCFDAFPRFNSETSGY